MFKSKKHIFFIIFFSFIFSILICLSYTYFLNNKSILKENDFNLLSSKSSTVSSNIYTISNINYIEKARKSVVEVLTQTANTNHAGSGIIYKLDKTDNSLYIITNYHVIEDSKIATIRLFNGELINNVKIVGFNKKQDIAVLLLNPSICKSNISSFMANIRDLNINNLKLAEEVYAIGNPLGQLGGTLTKGIISCLERTILLNNNELKVIQTDASINSGNSGGGLFDNYGQLIGIINAKVCATGVEGLGFAIPINTATKIANEIIKTHKHNEEYEIIKSGHYNKEIDLGFECNFQLYISSSFNLYKGVFITKIDINSQAYNNGLRKNNKLIEFKINNENIVLDESFNMDNIEIKENDKIFIKALDLTSNKEIEISLNF